MANNINTTGKIVPTRGGVAPKTKNVKTAKKPKNKGRKK